MNMEFTAKAGFIMYVFMNYLNLARGSSVAPPVLSIYHKALVLAK